MITCRLSSVRPSTALNNFSSETPEPIFFKLHVEPSVKRGIENLFKWSWFVNQDGRYAHITLKILLQNQESSKAEFWYIASWTQGLPSLFKCAILVAGKGREVTFLFLLFLHFHSCSSFFPVPPFYLFCYLFCLFSPFLWEMTQNDPQGLTCC